MLNLDSEGHELLDEISSGWTGTDHLVTILIVEEGVILKLMLHLKNLHHHYCMIV